MSDTSQIRRKQGKWTEKENAYVKEYYPYHTASEIAMILNRSPRAIRIQAHNLGVKKR